MDTIGLVDYACAELISPTARFFAHGGDDLVQGRWALFSYAAGLSIVEVESQQNVVFRIFPRRAERLATGRSYIAALTEWTVLLW
jgi:hypothetical protein